MSQNFLVLTLLLIVNVVPGHSEATIDSRQFIIFCEEATVLLIDGTRIQGTVTHIGGDSLWIEALELVSSEAESSSTSSTRRFWGSSPEEPARPVEPPPSSRMVCLFFGDIHKVSCGDPISDGALAGMMAAVVVGGPMGLVVASISEGPGPIAIPIIIGILAAPTTVLGAILDQTKGGRAREYDPDQLHRIVEVSEGVEGAGVTRYPSYHNGTSFYLGAFYKRMRPLESDIDDLNMIGGRLMWLGRSEISYEPFLAYAESGGEHWMNLGFDLCLNAFNPEPISLFGSISFNYYNRDVSGKTSGVTMNPDDNHFFSLALGGGLVIRTLDNRLLFRPGISLRFPFFDVTPHEIVVGGYYRF